MVFRAITMLPGVAPVLSQERTFDWSWSTHPMPWMMGLWGFGMMLIMLLFWGAVIVGIVVLVRWLVSAGSTPRDRAVEILRERYARGEIDKNEFESRRRDLR
jgi:putative membrane protein